LSLLQRLLLLPDLLPPQSLETAYWPEVVFDKSLLHLITELLRPEVFASDKRGMGETRVLAQGLLCKIYLHCLGRLSEEDATRNGKVALAVWADILDVLIRLIGSGQKDVVVSSQSESQLIFTGGSGTRVTEKCVASHGGARSPHPAKSWRGRVLGSDLAEIGSRITKVA
jgi:hypothetical protein